MDKKRFSYLLENYRSLTNKETVELLALQSEFPYSQPIRNMATWGVYHHHLFNKKEQLYLATVYAADRAVLKAIITAPKIDRSKIAEKPHAAVAVKEVQHKELSAPAPTPIPIPAAKPVKPAALLAPLAPSVDDTEINKLLAELPHDLDKLKKSKNKFELTLHEFNEVLQGAPGAYPDDSQKEENKGHLKKLPRVGEATSTYSRKKIAKKTVKKAVSQKKPVKRAKNSIAEKKVLQKKALRKVKKETVPKRAAIKRKASKKAVPRKAIKKKAGKKATKKATVRGVVIKKVKKKTTPKRSSVKGKTITKKIKRPATKKPAKKRTTGKVKRKEIASKRKKSLKKTLQKKNTAKKKQSSPGVGRKAQKNPLGVPKKQQEQFEIIDRFLKSKPTMKHAQPDQGSSPDLPEVDYLLSEGKVSETLVQVLIEQGKYHEAIDILKKLIWKTPQKKAHFMAQIKRLESKL